MPGKARLQTSRLASAKVSDGGRQSGKRRQRDPAEKRTRILRAARALFVERGYATTTTADIAARARVSEGIVFHHFGTKAGILEAVGGDYGRKLAEAMFKTASQGKGSPPARAMLSRAFGYVRENGARLLSAEPGDASVTRRASRTEIVEALARGYEHWSRRGVIRRMDARIVAELTYALVEAALTECFVRGDGSREQDYLRETVICIEGALRKKKSR